MDSPTRICKLCGQEFTPYRGMAWQEFCCPPHRAQYYERYVRHSCAEALKILDGEEEENEKSAGG